MSMYAVGSGLGFGYRVVGHGDESAGGWIE